MFKSLVKALQPSTTVAFAKSTAFTRFALARSFADGAPTEQAGKQIFVGNLPWETTEADLTTLFSSYGKVPVVKVMKDAATGRPRGFAFVTLDGDLSKAVAELNGKDLKGRPIRVSEATAKPPRQPGSGGFGGDRRPRRFGDRRPREEQGEQQQ